MLSDRKNREEWEAEGSKDTQVRATEIVKQILAETPYELPEATRKQVLANIEGIVD